MSNKRVNSVSRGSAKRLKNEQGQPEQIEEDLLEDSNQKDDEVNQSESDTGDDDFLHEEEEAKKKEATKKRLTPSQKNQIALLTELLKRAHADAPYATQHPDIYDIIDQGWHTLSFEPNGESLAHILYVEEGWSVARLTSACIASPIPIGLPPMNRKDSRALWDCIRYREALESKKAEAQFEMELPEEWLHIKVKKKKQMRKTNSEDYLKRLAAEMLYNQEKFLNRKEYWFQPMCEELGWEISKAFVDRHRIALLVVCVDPKLIIASTKDITKSWADAKWKVHAAFTSAVKAGVQKKKIKYKSAFKFFQKIFPSVLF